MHAVLSTTSPFEPIENEFDPEVIDVTLSVVAYNVPHLKLEDPNATVPLDDGNIGEVTVKLLELNTY
jgi:hypothetical protein